MSNAVIVVLGVATLVNTVGIAFAIVVLINHESRLQAARKATSRDER